jgi:demethylmenaquinone methyltransferase/2-methoxy-6-polyprenyl-1,4-benzoquinol methylase
LARAASHDPVAYDYLTDSILDWPDQRTLAHLLGEAGWTDIEWRNLSGGIVALHRARRPVTGHDRGPTAR